MATLGQGDRQTCDRQLFYLIDRSNKKDSRESIKFIII